MRKTLLAAVAAALVATTTAHANAVSDPVGDFLPSFVGTPFSDLDVTSFSVAYDPVASMFDLGATLAGPIDPSHTGIYAIGIDTGAGAIRPFGSIGEPNVVFDQVAVLFSTGAAFLAGGPPLSAAISGDSFSMTIPLALLPSTGFAAPDYRFNLWPRIGLVSNDQISDFAPENSTLSATPEPGVWALMIAGFGLAGTALRIRRRPVAV